MRSIIKCNPEKIGTEQLCGHDLILEVGGLRYEKDANLRLRRVARSRDGLADMLESSLGGSLVISWTRRSVGEMRW